MSLEVNQGFFQGEKFNFHPNLNCLVGGKGVGKSFTIELIRFALGSPSMIPMIREDGDAKISALLGKNGKVTLLLEDERGKFMVERSFFSREEKPRVFKYGEEEALDVDIADFFRIDVYSQGEIVEIARSPFAQLKIVDSFLNISREVRTEKNILDQLKENALLLSERQNTSIEYDALKSDLTLLREKIKLLEVRLNDPVLKSHQKWIEEKNYFYHIEKGLDTYLVQLFKKWQEVDFDELFPRVDFEGSPSASVMGEALTLISETRSELDSVRANIKNLIGTKKQLLREKFDRWSERFKEAQSNYKDFLKELNVPEVAEAEREYQSLKEKEMGLKHRISIMEKENKSSEELIQKRKNLLEELEKIQKNIFEKRVQVTEEIEKKLKGKIKLNITFKGRRDDYLNKLLKLTQGTRIPEDDLDKIVSAFLPPQLINLVLFKDYGNIASGAGISEVRAKHIGEFLLSLDRSVLYDIETISLYDDPELMLKVNEEYKYLEELSLGAKCTAIIYIAMVGGEYPLIIDQPEDALDTLSIYDVIVKKLRKEKEKRQFILATHNPNILVAADAELSLVLGASAHSGSIQSGGGLDRPSTRELLLLNLEGGKEAFMMRNQKYAIGEED